MTYDEANKRARELTARWGGVWSIHLMPGGSFETVGSEKARHILTTRGGREVGFWSSRTVIQLVHSDAGEVRA